MSVYYYKNPQKKMVLQATVETKLACGALTLIILNVCFLIAIIAIISKEEMCMINMLSTTTKPPQQSQNRIGFNEYQTTINQYPWMLAFLILPDQTFIGTATIITEKWAITTAYCVEKVSNYPISKKGFRGGSTFWNKDGYYHFAAKIISHEKFDPYTLDYNVALIEVSIPFVQPNERPLSLSVEYFKLVGGSPAEIIGWAILNDTNYVSHSLIMKKATIISETSCRQTLNRLKNDSSISRSICANNNLGILGNKCIFTSGSALVVKKKLIGMSSWGATCSDTRWPGVYVFLKTVMEWIKDIKTREEIPINLS